jgi:hypothetical protein
VRQTNRQGLRGGCWLAGWDGVVIIIIGHHHRHLGEGGKDEDRMVENNEQDLTDNKRTRKQTMK